MSVLIGSGIEKNHYCFKISKTNINGIFLKRPYLEVKGFSDFYGLVGFVSGLTRNYFAKMRIAFSNSINGRFTNQAVLTLIAVSFSASLLIPSVSFHPSYLRNHTTSL